MQIKQVIYGIQTNGLMIKLIIDEKLETYTEKITEVLDLSFEYLGFQHEIIAGLMEIEEDDILMCYSLNRPKNREITDLIKYCKCSNIFFVSFNPDLYEKLTEAESKKLKKEFSTFHVLSPMPPDIQEKKDDFTRCFFYNFDLFGNIYQFSTYQVDSSNKPICNLLLNNFLTFIEECVDDDHCMIRKKMWPNNEKFAISLIAEIDRLYKWKSYSKTLKKIIKNLFSHPISAIKEYFTLNFKNDEPYWNFYLLEAIPKLTYCLLKNNSNFDPENLEVKKELFRINKNLVKADTENLPVKKNIFFPSEKEELFASFSSKDLMDGDYKIADESSAQTQISSLIDYAYQTNGAIGFSFRFSDLYDIKYSLNLIKKIVKIGHNPEIYFDSQKEIKTWLKKRKQLKFVTDKNIIEVASNFDIDQIVLEIMGNFEVETFTGCQLRTEDNLIYLSEIKKYTSINISLKKFYPLNKTFR